MAQTSALTNEGFAEWTKLICGEAATKTRSVCLIKTSCTANATQTYAGITQCSESGLTIADGTVTSEKTTVTDDTVRVVHTHTAGASATVLGGGFCNDDNDQLEGIVCYNASLAIESGDTIKNQFDTQLKSA